MEKTIMIVDDSESARLLVLSTLQTAGYRVVEATDGKEALAKLDERISVVLTDLTMPDMDGIELVKAIRAIPAFRSLPIIMLTTETHGTEKKKAKIAGATGWMVKPFNPDQLVAALKRVTT